VVIIARRVRLKMKSNPHFGQHPRIHRIGFGAGSTSLGKAARLQRVHFDQRQMVGGGAFKGAVVRTGGLINHQADLGSIYSVEDEYSAKLSTRMGHGRLYAGQIAQEQTVIQRTYGAMRSVLVPGLFIFRGVRDSFSMNNDGLSFMKLFWLVMLSSAWGVGEIRGYLTGAGDSLGSWR